MNDETTIEAAAGAFREVSARGEIRTSPDWADLDAEGRREAFARAATSRRLEAALDPDGLSSTARAVLARIRRGGG